MPKSEHTIISTSLGVAEVKGILSNVLSGATVEPLDQGPLDGEAALAILAMQRGGALLGRSPFGPGNAVAQVIVEDHGSARQVELVAIKDTVGDGLRRQLGAGNAINGLRAMKQAPSRTAGRKMVDAIVQALEDADPNVRSMA